MTDSEERSIGRLEARVEHLAATLEEVRRDVRTITALVEQGKGARWVMGLIGALAGGIASFLLAAFSMSRTP